MVHFFSYYRKIAEKLFLMSNECVWVLLEIITFDHTMKGVES